jgi:ATP diphosphatase
VFGFEEVVAATADKLVRRHPNVFADQPVESAAEQVRAWGRHKADERERAAERSGRTPSALDGVALGLPALARAQQLVRRAAGAGFAWPDPEPALAKLEEEIRELREELVAGRRERVQEELGDLLIASAGLAHALDVDAEAALRDSGARFERRLRALESELAREGRRMRAVPLSELLERWERAKRDEETLSLDSLTKGGG